MKRLKKILKVIGWTIAGFVAFVLLYLLGAFVFSRIGVNKDNLPSGNDVTIYILSNGVHTDIVVPVRNEYKDWTNEVLFDNTKSKDSNMLYVAMGWGDKGFYLETPQWSDLKFSVAFNAMFYMGNSAMHTTFYKTMHEHEQCKKITISKEHYCKLVEYLEASFEHDSQGKIVHIKADYSYGNNDAFYEAVGSYGLFNTCNTWANSALKYAGERACLWTPSDKGIFYQYRK